MVLISLCSPESVLMSIFQIDFFKANDTLGGDVFILSYGIIGMPFTY